MRECQESMISFAVFRMRARVERSTVVATSNACHRVEKRILQAPTEPALSSNCTDETLFPFDGSGQFLLQKKQIGNESVGFDKSREGHNLLIRSERSPVHKCGSSNNFVQLTT